MTVGNVPRCGSQMTNICVHLNDGLTSQWHLTPSEQSDGDPLWLCSECLLFKAEPDLLELRALGSDRIATLRSSASLDQLGQQYCALCEEQWIRKDALMAFRKSTIVQRIASLLRATAELEYACLLLRQCWREYPFVNVELRETVAD